MIRLGFKAGFRFRFMNRFRFMKRFRFKARIRFRFDAKVASSPSTWEIGDEARDWDLVFLFLWEVETGFTLGSITLVTRTVLGIFRSTPWAGGFAGPSPLTEKYYSGTLPQALWFSGTSPQAGVFYGTSLQAGWFSETSHKTGGILGTSPQAGVFLGTTP